MDKSLDPDGDVVNYTIITTDTLAKKITDTTYTITNATFNSTINGKIVAKDPKGLSTEATFTATTAKMILIPDPIFEQALLDKRIDSDGLLNGLLKPEDALKVTELNVSNSGNNIPDTKKIKDLTGIEGFVNLKKLYCNQNQLSKIDIGKNTALTDFLCSWNNLTTLDVSKNISLVVLEFAGNQLTNIDISNNMALTSLNCFGNLLTTLDIRDKILLTWVQCTNNSLKALDISKNTSLVTLYCNYNKMTILDISNNTKLQLLNCRSNQLTNLDLSKNSLLTSLECGENPITILDVSKIENLMTIACDRTPTLKTICVKNVAEAKSRSYWYKDATAEYKICQ